MFVGLLVVGDGRMQAATCKSEEEEEEEDYR